MAKRTLSISAKLEATEGEFWITCKVGRKTYKTHCKRDGEGVGYISHVDGDVFDELDVEDWLINMLNAMEEGAWYLMCGCE
jgi:hypothetical protein